MKDEAKKDTYETKEYASNVVNSRTPVLLQTARGVVADNYEKRSMPVTILLDPGSQRTYISERIVKQLKLEPQGSQSIIVNTVVLMVNLLC